MTPDQQRAWDRLQAARRAPVGDDVDFTELNAAYAAWEAVSEHEKRDAGSLTVRLCGDHWQEHNPTEYLPNVTTEGTCEECGDGMPGLTYRMRRADWQPAGTFTAGWNMPGCLPETDPQTFDTLSEAWDYLADTLQRWIDEDYAARDDDPDLGTPDTILNAGEDWIDGEYGGLHLWAEPTQH